MAQMTYGEIEYNIKNDSWIIKSILPQAAIKLKKIFSKVYEYAVPPIEIKNSTETAVDMEWFLKRYPFKMAKNTESELTSQADEYRKMVEKSERIIMPNYKPKKLSGLKEGHQLDSHQLVAIDFLELTQRYLLVDPIGSGKTYTAVGAALKKGSLPAAFVLQKHLTKQFKNKIEEITNLTVHMIKTKKPYSLPKADIYIFKYSILSGWVDIATTGFFKYVLFDEVQELRHGTSTAKGAAAKVFTDHAQKVMATTGTPIYGYGIEFFNVLDIIKKGSLGTHSEFLREWCTHDNKKIKDTKAFGAFLRESRLMLHRTKEEAGVGNLPSKIIPETVDYDAELVKSTEDLAKQLAIKTLTGSFTESGQSARQLDVALRLATGVSKAKNVAYFVRMLVESGEKVLLSAWHRDVYEIVLKELKDLKPVMFTGTESDKQKSQSVDDFVNGDAQVFILSHISGSGLDGLQHASSTVVIGELAWSERIHEQIIGRLLRRGQKKEVFAFILMSEFGSDPVIKDILDIKYEQQHGVLNPEIDGDNESIEDDIDLIPMNKEKELSRLKQMASKYLENIETEA